jgi:WD40 repeat protein
MSTYVAALAFAPAAVLASAQFVITARPVNPAVISSVAFDPTGSTIAAAGGHAVSLIDSRTGRGIAQISASSGSVSCVRFSPDGKWLAAAGGLPGRSGEVRLWRVPVSASSLALVLTGPSDVVQSIAFSPDSRRLAAASYDHDVTVWDVTAKNPKPKSLRDHTDSVYAVVFSPDGRLIASAGGDRTVKVWSAATGKRLFTLSESTAEAYALAFRPDGGQIAAGGADKQLRTWNVTVSGGKLVKSAFAHNGAILAVAYSRDGLSIVTAGEDNAVKRWDSSTLVEKKVYPKLPDWPQGIALSPDGKLLAVGCQNGQLALYDVSTGRLVREPLRGTPVAAVSKEAPLTTAIPGRKMGDNKQRRPVNNGGVTLVAASLGDIAPRGAVRGGTVRFTLFGGKIADASRVVFDDPTISAKIVTPADPNQDILRVDAALNAGARLGIHQVFVQSPHGTTGAVPFAVGGWPEVAQVEPNNTPESGQRISFPCTVVGALDTPGDVDCFRFDAKAGQELVFEVVAQQLRSRLQPVVALMDGAGTTLAESGARIGRPDTLLGYRFMRDGSYVLKLRDYESAGGADVHYRLNAGAFPVVADVFPLGAQSGTTAEVEIQGFNLGGATTASVLVPPGSGSYTTVPVTLNTPAGPLYLSRSIQAGPDPEVGRAPGNESPEHAQRVVVPCAVNGRLDTRQPHFYRFHAARGERLTLDVWARRAGSSLDSDIEVLDANGKPIERAVIRPVYQTEITLNDRDSATNALRIFAWDAVGIGDYIMVGREVVKVVEMPRGPDSDIFFRTFRGQRLTYFGTTPEYHSLGQPVYKVEIHPAGATFSPNGYPVTRLTYRNDDGGPLFGKDSHLDFIAPSDGDYLVRLKDTRGQFGSDYAYRLLIHRPRPDYRLSISPGHPNLPKAGATVVNVECERLDGFEGAIALRLEGLPTGFSATSTEIEPVETSASLLITAAPDAVTPSGPVELRLMGRARIGGRDIVHTVDPGAAGRLITLLGAPDAYVEADLQTLTIHPGEEVSLEVRLDRQGKFGGRVPIDVKNLPFGVQVQNIGLNGILVTEEESTRTISIRCEPWVKPQTRPFYVVANIEGGVPSPGIPVLLTVVPAGSRTTPRAALARRK